MSTSYLSVRKPANQAAPAGLSTQGRLVASEPHAGIRDFAQGSLDALFPDDSNGLSATERYAVALHVSRLAGSRPLQALYRERLQAHGASAAVVATAGIESGGSAEVLNGRLRAILRYAALLTTQRNTLAAVDLPLPTDERLAPREVATLAQLVSFLAFQIRTIASLPQRDLLQA